jgi:hypothetical protein
VCGECSFGWHHTDWPVPYVGGTYASNILPIRYEPHHDLVRGLLSGDGE